MAVLCGACAQESSHASNETASSAPPARAATDTASDLRLFLAGNGIELINTQTGASRLIRFGTRAETARALIERVIGPENGMGGPLDCSGIAGYAVDHDRSGLALYFAGGRFVAWEQGPNFGIYRTRSGITPGMSRADLLRIGHVSLRLQQNVQPPGEDFTSGSIRGSVEEGRVVELNAGDVCQGVSDL